MADGPDENPVTEFELPTSALGTLTCSRIKVSAWMRVMRQIGDDPAPAPQKAVRALVSAIAAREDGAEVQPSEADALSEREVELFAREVLNMHEELRSEEWTPGAPATPILAAGMKRKEAALFAPVTNSGLGAVGGLAGLKDGFPGAAIRAAGSPVLAAGTVVGTARPMPEELARVVAPPRPRPAEAALRLIAERRAAFAAGLPEDREAAMVVISAPGGPSFYVQESEAVTSDMVSFRGFDGEGEPVEVVQHHTQCNVMFLPVRKAATKGPLGFTPGSA